LINRGLGDGAARGFLVAREPSMASAPAPRLQLLAAAVLFSTGGAGIKACTLSSWQIASFRSAIAVVALLLMWPEARSRWTCRAVVVGLAYAATMILFVAGNKLTTAANTIFLQSTAPLYILLLGPWLLRESIRRSDVWFMAALALGLSLFFVGVEPAFVSAPHPGLGNVIAAVSGVTWALTIVGLRRMASARQPTGPAVVAGNAIACCALLPWALPVHASVVTDWLTLGYLGVFQIGLAYVCVGKGVRQVPALEASLLLLLEPVLNPVWAWAFQGERPGTWSLAGGAMILMATTMKAISSQRSVIRDAERSAQL